MHSNTGFPRLATGVAVTLLALAATGAAAQGAASRAWAPDRQVTLIVPYAAGGGTDAAARAISRSLAAVWRQPVVVENVPGADGMIGTRKTIDAKPDGYTMLLQVPSVALAVHDPASKGFDPLAHLEPITAVADTPPAFVSTAKVPARTLPELVQYCKSAATPCSFGTGEKSAKLMARKFAQETGISNLIVVNYKGTSAIVPDLMAGNVTIAYTGITAALPHHKTGALRILSTLGPARSPSLPEVPTVRESGLATFESVTWYGLFAPKGTPKAITEAIATAVREAGKDPDLQRAIQLAGAVPVLNTTDEFVKQVEFQRARYGALAKQFPLTD